MKTIWTWNRMRSIRTAGLLAGVLVSGTVAVAADRDTSLVQPEGVLGAVTPTASTNFNSVEWSAYVDDAAAIAPEVAGCNECNSCDCCNQGCCGHGDSCCINILPTDHCYDCFISPMTNPVFFEDPAT